MFWLIVVVSVVLDQLSKYWMMSHFAYGQSLPIIPNIFHLTYILNEGAAFSILSGKTWLLIVISLVAMGGIFWYYRQVPKEQVYKQLALACITGGAFGNFIDRIWLGAVRDFFDFRIWPIFNIADCFVVVGVTVLIICLTKEIYEESKAEKNNKK